MSYEIVTRIVSAQPLAAVRRRVLLGCRQRRLRIRQRRQRSGLCALAGLGGHVTSVDISERRLAVAADRYNAPVFIDPFDRTD